MKSIWVWEEEYQKYIADMRIRTQIAKYGIGSPGPPRVIKKKEKNKGPQITCLGFREWLKTMEKKEE